MPIDLRNNTANTPLVLRPGNALIADADGQTITARTFEQQVTLLRDALPQAKYAINICSDRFTFQRTMAAVIAAGQCNLLPPNKQQATLQKLTEQYQDCYIINDDDTVALPDVAKINDQQLKTSFSGPSHDVPELLIPDSQLAAISFTSGSTGESRPNVKSWSMLHRGNAINIDNMLRAAPAGLNMLATVPPQHMYGLELSVLMPLAADVCVYSGQPLFPYDIQLALQGMPAPRALVSTPQHLQALLGSSLEFPTVDLIYSATAPMDQSLARQVEECFNGTIIEIFGCSEVGSIARRETARDISWTPFSAMNLSCDEGKATVNADHIDTPYELQDAVRMAPDGTFTLEGRLTDLINIAGKRGSLSQINQVLMTIPQVRDSIVFEPQSDEITTATQRLAAIVVADGIDKHTLLQELKRHLDPVFLPRPIVFTTALPRNETGKLPREQLLAFYAQLRQS